MIINHLNDTYGWTWSQFLSAIPPTPDQYSMILWIGLGMALLFLAGLSILWLVGTEQ